MREEVTQARIGAYRLLEAIGSGAMGTVYSAVREGEFEQRVAVKVVNRGADTPGARRRIRNEGRILAALRHPSIALLYDAGVTADGAPYLAMELVEGQTLTAWARGRDVRSRLETFLAVCEAVSHAHRNLIVHRDLKPSNILVGLDGRPKLLDFGVAKLLEETGGEAGTETTVPAFTPAYASPEQVLGLAATASVDVYSLGVVLFEMLTGELPYVDAGSPLALQVAIVEQAPRRGSEAGGATLAGDLDTIVEMALRKEPGRRYGSVEMLAEDIRRHLDHLPVLARADSAGYRLGKFARRHRLGVGAAALALVALAGGAAYTGWQARRAGQRFEETRVLANAFLFDFHDQLESLGGSTEARSWLVRTGLDYLERLERDSGGPGLDVDIAAAYEKIGDVQGGPAGPNLGQMSAALESYRRSAAMLRRVRSARPGRETDRNLARVLMKAGDLETKTNMTTHAIGVFREAMEVARRSGAATAEDHRLMGDGYARLGQLYGVQGDIPKIVLSFRTSNAHYRELEKLAPGAQHLGLLAASYQRSGYSLVWRGELEAAERAFEDAIRTGRETLRVSPANAGARRDLALAHVSLGDLHGGPFHINLGDPARAEPEYRRAIELAEGIVRQDGKNVPARVQMLQARRRLGTALRGRDARAALTIAGEVLAEYEALIKAEPRNNELRRDRGFTLMEIGLSQEALGNRGAAGVALRAAIETQRRLVDADPARIQFRQDMAATHLFAARLEAAGGRAGEAKAHLGKALELAEAQRTASPLNLYSFRNLADCFEAHGELAAAQGEVATAREWLLKAAAVWGEWESAHGPNRFVEGRKARVAAAAARLGAR